MNRLIVFTHPRSGSTSLTDILSLHPDVRLLFEPFNEGFTSWVPGNPDYLSRTRTVEATRDVLEEIFAEYNALKIHSYQLAREVWEDVLLDERNQIVFLYRRNHLQAVVSDRIAKQTNLYQKSDAARPLTEYFEALEPLDIDDIRNFVDWFREHIPDIRGVLERRDGGWMQLTYEGLYLRPVDEQLALVDSVWDFLGLTHVPHELVMPFLSPDVQISAQDTYGRLPNYRDIDEQCGSEETGWLAR